MSTKQTTYKWDTYVAEAQAEDFILEKPDGEQVRISNPTGARVLRLAQGLREGDLDMMLVALCGDTYPEVRELVATAGHKAFPKLVEDLMDHFDLYEDLKLVGPEGNTVTARRPTEVRRFRELGYVPMGEAKAPRG